MMHSTSVDRTFAIVLGMHRSGTSLCSNIMSALGFDMADKISLHEHNQRGHWERWEIVAFHDRVLKCFGRDWYSAEHAQPLPLGWWAQPKIRQIRNEMIDFIGERLEKRRQFGLKDPRVSRMLPLWFDIIGQTGWNVKFVFCVRDPAQVVRSISARDKDKIPLCDGEYRWLVYNFEAVRDLSSSDVSIISYEDWFVDAKKNLDRLMKILGTAWPLNNPVLDQTIQEIIDPSVRHDSTTKEKVSPSTKYFYETILDSALNNTFNDEARSTAKLLSGLQPLIAPMHASKITEADLIRRATAAEEQSRELAGNT